MVGYLNVALVALAAIAPAAAAPFNPKPFGRRDFLVGEAGREIVARALQVDPALIQALGGLTATETRGLEARGESLVTRCICPGPTKERPFPPACGCAVTTEDLLPQGTNLTSLLTARQLPSDISSLVNGRRDVAVDPNSIVATGGVPGGGILSKITQGIGSLLGLRGLDARDEFHEELVSRCTCPSPPKENPIFTCGCAFPSEIQTSAFPADISSLVNGRRDVAVDPNSIVATGGVPGGGILSKITQGIGSLLGL